MTYIFIHGQLPFPPGELTDGNDGRGGNAGNQHHVETGQGSNTHLITTRASSILTIDEL